MRMHEDAIIKTRINLSLLFPFCLLVEIRINQNTHKRENEKNAIFTTRKHYQFYSICALQDSSCYSTDIKFLHQSIGCLSFPGCTNTQANMSKEYAKHTNDPRSLQIKATFSFETSIHPCPGSWVAIGRVVVYYVQVARAFSAGIKYLYFIESKSTQIFLVLKKHTNLPSPVMKRPEPERH